MSALAAAETALRLAESSLASVDAELTKARASEAEILGRLSKLYSERESAAYDDAATFIATINATQDEHDKARATVTQLERMLAPAERKADDARRRLDTARIHAAEPEARRLEALAREAFDRFVKSYRASINFRRDNGLPATGLSAAFATDESSGLYETLRAHDLRNDLTPR